MHKIIRYFILISLTVHSLSAQEKVSFDTIARHLADQLTIYPKEKLHLHIDRSCYLPGDTLWFKVYMVNTSSHIPIRLSRYVHVELVTPENETVDRVKIRPDENNQFYGYLSIPEHIPGGNYTLLAYTRYMLAEENQPVFKRKVCIALANDWETAHLKASLLSVNEENTEVHLQLLDNRQKQIELKKVKAVYSKGNSVSAKLNKEKNMELHIQNERIVSGARMRIDMTDIRDNIYQQYAAISTGTEDYDITFYPEGGHLLAGTSCRIAYKVLDISGNSLDVTLNLMDEQGNVMVKTETFYAGMGMFTFIPEIGKRYTIQAFNKLGVKKNFELPLVHESAYGIIVKYRKEDIQISVNSAISAPQDELLLLVHVRGKLIRAQWLSSKKNDVLTIAKDQYPSGVIQCLLLDKKYHVLSERLGFIPYRKAIVCRMMNNKDRYGKRELVHTSLLLTDVNGNSVKGNFSIAITDQSMTVADTAHSILSSLLLTSELKGKIETPSFYLQENNHKAERALDLLLMTHGWKRYRLPEIIKGNFEKPVMEAERYTFLSGKLKDKMNKNKSRYDIIVRNLDIKLNREIKPDRDGAFRLDSLEFAEGTPIGIIGRRFIRKGERYGRNKTEIIMDEEQSYNVLERTFSQPIISEISNDFFRQGIIYPTDVSQYSLRQVTVKSWALNKDMNSKEIAKLKFKNVWELVQYLGMKFSYPFIWSGMDGSCKIGGTSWGTWMCLYKDMPLVFIINGVVSQNAGILNYLSLSDIRAIRLYNTDRKKFFSLYNYPWSYEGHSSIAILELRLHPDININHLLYITSIECQIKAYGKLDIQTDVYPFGGYQEPVEFYSPKYDKGNNIGLIPDFRSTLYWNPNLQTDSLGKCDFSFYTADKATTYKMVFEGMTEDGEVVYETSELKIK